MASLAYTTIEANATELLKGKSPLPVIGRVADPGIQVYQRGCILEVLMASLKIRMGTATETEASMWELVAAHAHLFRNPQSLREAIAVRNGLSHPRTRPVSMPEKSRAAQALLEAIEDLLPRVSPELREAVMRDPHEPGESESLAQIRSASLTAAESMQKLTRRLDALLAMRDARERNPAYDLTHGQYVPSLLQRLMANSGCFKPTEALALVTAARFATEVRTYTEQKLRHLDKKLRSSNRTLEGAVEKLEIELGIPQAVLEDKKMEEIEEPVAVGGEPAVLASPAEPVTALEEPTIQLCVEQPVNVAEETEIAVSVAEPLVAAAEPDGQAAQPTKAPRAFRVRIRFTPSAVRMAQWMRTAAACATVVAGLGCLLASGRSSEPAPVAVRIGPDAPALMFCTRPTMTPEARRAGVRGTLVLRIWVNGRGVPQQIEVRNRLGYGLETMAVAAAWHWRFTPSRDAANVPAEVPVEFDAAMEQ